MLSKIPRTFWAIAIIIAVVAFYVYSNLQRNRGDDQPRVTIGSILGRPQSGGQHAAVPFDYFTGVEMLRNPRSEELIAEIDALIEQRGLPADVFRGLIGERIDGEQPNPQFINIALTLNNSFGRYYEIDPHAPAHDPRRPLNDSMDRLWDASPIGEWDVDAQALNSIRETLVYFEGRRQSIRNELRAPNTRFHYIFIRPGIIESEITVRGRTVTSRTTASGGTRVNTGASKYLADYALLEEYEVAQALLEGNIQRAMEALMFIFRIAYLASILEDVGTRADVAHVRLRAFDVMQRVVLDPAFERQHMVSLRTILVELHRNWVPEQDVWFGDRADGLMFYQRVVLEGLHDRVQSAELQALIHELTRRGITLDVANRGFRSEREESRPRTLRAIQRMNEASLVLRNHREEDTVFYLRAMQRIIDISREPFVNRRGVLDQINSELQALQNVYDADGILLDPFVAAFRLRDVERFMVLFAQDQSAMNRALVAIHHSLGQTNTSMYRDPFTGEPYKVEIDSEGLVSVEATRLPRPFRVPVVE